MLNTIIFYKLIYFGKANKKESDTMENKTDRHDPEYQYKNNDFLISKKYEYPIIERSNNGLLFPEGPQSSVDFKDFED